MLLENRLTAALSSIAMLALFGSALAEATPLSEKHCVYSSAAKLPAIPTMTLPASRTRPGPEPADAVRRLINHYDNHALPAAEQIDRELPLGPSVMQSVRRHYQAGDNERAMKVLSDALVPEIASTMFVEIDAVVAGVEATFHFLCVQTANGRMALKYGIIR